MVVTLGRLVLSTCRVVTNIIIGLEVSSDVGEQDPIAGRGCELRACGFSLCFAPVTWR